ncbi:MAG: hypothetical protein D6728_02275 [Cyanobacteria bacterium J055]|nr:MAG: hypothetical protein D6728_02275 [Cyanobacteria bacterium J055]
MFSGDDAVFKKTYHNYNFLSNFRSNPIAPRSPQYGIRQLPVEGSFLEQGEQGKQAGLFHFHEF